jgi:hypothetical protein
MQRAAAAEVRLERGVYFAPYIVGDYEVLIAIDSRGRARKHLKLVPGLSEERATAWLRQWLDRINPVEQPPKLELVTETRAARRPAPAVPRNRYRSADPNDFHAYRNRLARSAAQRVRLFSD